jgi:hypothetical protein
MMALYKPNIHFLSEHAVDPDKRRYILTGEAARHYIDIDHYGSYPFTELPRQWDSALAKYTADTLNNYGIVPWWTQTMLRRLTAAFTRKNKAQILKLSADIGHYIADAHVPLHACSNHNGQHTGQEGIHAFWESRLPELLAEKEWNFFIGPPAYIENPSAFIWDRVLESAAAADSVLAIEKKLSQQTGAGQRFAFEERNGKLVRQYASAYSRSYNRLLRGMVERRMRQSVYAVASFWYTAWVNAGQPDLKILSGQAFSAEDMNAFAELDAAWKNGKQRGKSCD